MQSKVEKFIKDNYLLKENSKVVLGVSGGADSMALLDVLQKAGYEVIVAHCNFHLRDKESVRDEIFVRTKCEEKDLIYKIADFDTIKYAAQHSISIEMAARELRYQWFEELRQQFDADAIAVAHHKDDSIETVIMNMVRGTGIRGLTGIEPRAGYIVRPFLCATRTEIEDYMTTMRLEYVDDSTNSESIYTRNIIRLDVMPYLERINPSAKESIHKTMTNLKQVENIYKEYIQKSKDEIQDNNNISIQKLKQLTEPEAVLYEILSEYHFKTAVIRDVYESLDGLSGKVFYSDTHRVLKDRSLLMIELLNEKNNQTFRIESENATRINVPIGLDIQKINISVTPLVINKSNNNLYLDYDKISYPLVLRRWSIGDWFVPFGMKNKKKLSDYFSDNKFSLFDKENVWLLCSGEDIVWIVGHRSDNRFKITDDTKIVLKISFDQC